MNTYFSIFAHGALFLLLMASFYLILKSIFLRERMKQGMEQIYTKLASKDNKRLENIEMLRRRYGSVVGKESGIFGRFLLSVDNMLTYSGFSIRYKWLNTSTYLVLCIVGGGVVFIGALLLGSHLLVAALATTFVLVLPIFRMVTAADNAYRCVETQMVLCVNLVANMGDATNSVTVVLKEVAPYMSDPLRTTIYRALSTIELTGVESDGIRQLCREVEHPMFVQFIRHLEITAKNDADFRKVARDYATQVDMSMRAAERQKGIFAKGRASILTLQGVGILLIYMLCSYTGSSVFFTLSEMSTNAFGILVLFVLSGVYVGAILYMLLGLRR